METLGIIGGLGIQASAEFYRRTLIAVRQSSGRTPFVILYSIPLRSGLEKRFVSIIPSVAGNESELVHYADAIGTAIDVLSSAGADTFAMPCFSLTPQMISIANDRSARIVNPFEGLESALVKFGSGVRVGVLATPYGVDVLTRNLQENLLVVPPPCHVQVAVVRAIEMVLAGRDVGPELSSFLTASKEYRNMVDVMVIGCSEVSIIKKPKTPDTLDLFDILIANTANSLIKSIEQDKSNVRGEPRR